MEQTHVMNDLYMVMSRFKKYNIGLLAEELSQGEFFMLLQIDRLPCEKPDGGQVSVSDIKRCCGVSMPAVSRMLHSMEKKRYVEFYASSQDKRTTFIRLTGEGRTALENAQKRVDAFLTKVTSLMGEDKVNQMVRMFETFADLVEQEMKNLYTAEKGTI